IQMYERKFFIKTIIARYNKKGNKIIALFAKNYVKRFFCEGSRHAQFILKYPTYARHALGKST
ncbi:MAG: hypothetical protein K2L72_04675, partial [Clostridia bacterium]|nr:hypothetical protein [Clostridia bacterium]